jgi:hypothetical protein
MESHPIHPTQQVPGSALTTYGPHGDFMKFDKELCDVTDYRVDFLASDQILGGLEGREARQSVADGVKVTQVE